MTETWGSSICEAGYDWCDVSSVMASGERTLSTLHSSCMFSDQVGPEPSVTGRGGLQPWTRPRTCLALAPGDVTPSGATVQPIPDPDNYDIRIHSSVMSSICSQ